jgi:hypothetical protein
MFPPFYLLEFFNFFNYNLANIISFVSLIYFNLVIYEFYQILIRKLAICEHEKQRCSCNFLATLNVFFVLKYAFLMYEDKEEKYA